MEIQSFLKFNDVDINSLTSVMKQYCDFKNQYYDYIVFFRIGSFYETYFEDAITFSKVGNVVLTRRKNNALNIPMAGITAKNIKKYIPLLLKDNRKIAIIDETDEKDENNILIRKVSKLYTRGCVYEHEYLNPNKSNYLASVYKKKELYEIAYADISTGNIFLSSGNFDEINCELARILPVELLVPGNLTGEKELYQNYKYEILREDFYSGEGENKAYNGLINYSKYILKEYFPSFKKAEEYSIKKYLSIDYSTRKNLELTKNAYNNNYEGSLLWALDFCKTPMGKRFLSNLISGSLYDYDEIIKRQNFLKKLYENKEKLFDLSEYFECIGDISRLTSKISNKTISPVEFLTLKYGLEPLKELFKFEKDLKIDFKLKQDDIKILKDYYYILDKTFEDDFELVKADKYIKKGANTELDILEEELEKHKKDIVEYEEYLKYETKISSLKINNKNGKYSIEINSKSQNSIPSDFMLVQKLQSIIKYTTSKLISLEEKILSTDAKIKKLRESIFDNLKKYSIEVNDLIREYSKKIAVIDASYSIICSIDKFDLSFPKIYKESKTLKVRNLKHPAAQKILGKFEPLDIDFSDSNFIFLTGINGVGKSTLLKALGNLIVLAQAGFAVPSLDCEIQMFDKVCAVLNVSDEIINKKSTHQMQMKYISYAINNLNDKSFLLMDEIGKNTSYKDGVSLCAAIIKYLTEKKKTKTVLSTHFIEIKSLIKEVEDKISFYKILDNEKGKIIKKGIAEKSEGIKIAQDENLPEEVILFAKEIKNNVLQFY